MKRKIDIRTICDMLGKEEPVIRVGCQEKRISDTLYSIRYQKEKETQFLCVLFNERDC